MLSVDDISDVSQLAAPTPKRQQHSRNLKLERYVAQNGKIPISIAPGQNKSISPQVVHFSNTIDMLTRDTFLVCFLKWADVTPLYIKLFKGDLHEQFSMNKVARAKQPYNQVVSTTTTRAR
ncbi:CACTA en-spm transposon protein [Cucumis melo var. makuwa]|uniref:CACTA en-spm transposon protein n=1 Tax=Cucumis melo var. makuwa TaxID=1194695 RepID=A0A5D3C773_CUCMM|nr:CACTA en-spm transposon protein [Cucumis melo var. makuwa]TYK07152.1 CACTA en-spm transposon protein [Cucumis melo var. makuwa]